MELTKDADLVACCIYREYLNRRKSGISKREAAGFSQDFYKSTDKLSSWSMDDFLYTLGELRRAGFVRTYITGSFGITDQLIIYMESRFKNGFIELTDFIAKFIP